MAYRFVYVARHGEAIDEGELSEAGRRQADALGRRIAGISFAAIHHGPLPRATETAHLVAAHLPGVPVYATEEVGDYLPYAPDTAAFPPSIKRFIDSYTPDEQAAGADLARAATEQFMTVPATMDADEHILIVTHNFLVAWFVRHALDAPPARWLGLNAANAALTIIRCEAGQPPRLLAFNDTGHGVV